MNNEKGFTLIELMIGLAIAAILFAAAGPAFGRLIDGTRCTTAVSQLTGSLATARIEAIRRNRPVSVCPSLDGRSCRADRRWEGGWIVFEDSGAGEPDSDQALIDRVDAVGDGLTISSTTGRREVRYLPDGWASGTNSTLRICVARRRELVATVVVNNSGRARSERVTNTPCPFD
ncbi:GspH/FimT family pseudopilin [Lysobacter claricitrinus]|uniref:GspH/FimT family pseudopilin n=1 Tax=Lysobacter claricitrinus TaxID=3367728 RepID=UPI0037DAF80A